MVGISRSPTCWEWTRARWPGDAGTSLLKTWRAGACDERARAGDPFKKNARSDREDRGAHEARDRRGPHDGAEVDTTDNGEDRRRAEGDRDRCQRQDGREAAQAAGLLPPGEPQEALPLTRSWARSRRAVRLHRQDEEGVRQARLARRERRHEEEGVGRELQERGPRLEPQTGTRQRPRLPLRRRGYGRSVRRLRRPGQPRVRLRRNLA